MTFYCFTNECLRDYILRYFGEYGSNYCGNCSNCLSQFETVDVTEIARGIAGCVESSRQRYGINVVIDTLHGANTAKIRNYRMDENPHYGELAKVPTHRLRQVANHLLLCGYLSTSNDEYAIVKLTEKTGALLRGEEAIEMKMAKEQEQVAKARKEKKGRKSAVAGAELSEAEETLFEKLRALRAEIAREEKVPPYIVFSDKTLAHMCILKPKTKAEMLEVSGVGAFKYEKYGERFLECVKRESGAGDDAAEPGAEGAVRSMPVTDYALPNPEDGPEAEMYYENDDLYFVDDSEPYEDWDLGTALEAWENGSGGGQTASATRFAPAGQFSSAVQPSTPGKKTSKKTKDDFCMTEDLAAKIHYSNRLALSDFVAQINELRDGEAMKRLTIKSVEQMLMEEGFYEERFVNGMPRRRLTEAGREFGIEAEKRVSEKGNEYEVFFYTKRAQRAIVEWLLEKG